MTTKKVGQGKNTEKIKESADAREDRLKKMGTVGSHIMFHLETARDLETRAEFCDRNGLEEAAKAYRDVARRHQNEAMELWGVDCGK